MGDTPPLLTLLYQLDCYGYYPKASTKDFEQLVVAIAANELEEKYNKQWRAVEPRYKTDPKNNTDQCVRVIYRLLKKMTQKKDNSYHIDMTARDLIDAINKIPHCSAEVDGIKIKLSRRINKKAFGFLPWTNKTELNYSIPFGGYNPTYSWSNDYSTVKAIRICQSEGCTAEESETVNSSSVSTVSCLTAGQITYTSAEFENNAFEIQKKVIQAEALGHRQGLKPDWYRCVTDDIQSSLQCYSKHKPFRLHCRPDL